MHSITPLAMLIIGPWLLVAQNPFMGAGFFYGLIVSVLLNVYLTYRLLKK